MIYRLLMALVLFVGTGHAAWAQDPLPLKTEKEKLSYALGVNTAKNMKRFFEMHGLEFDTTLLEKGFRDGFTKDNAALSEAEIKDVLAALQKKLTEKQEAERVEQEKKRVAEGEKNKTEGEAFLGENREREGVKTLPSGLQYKVLQEGTGDAPKASDTVTVHYKGTLVDGTEFDSSYKRGQPATFPVDGVIKGWTEALQLMKEGAKWRIFLPPELAYGETGTPGGPIGPNATLIFEVELISVGK